ncbi:MAG: mechanosensitive ion channel family protein [Methylococcales bacterium]|nr:mechanosensitive ion channel family protein [Methylococcales bacterium]
MRSLYLRLLICVPALLVCTHAAGQDLLGVPPALEAGAAKRADPLGRQSPSGSFLGFLTAVRLGKYQTAAQYLQLSPARKQSQGEQLAIKLQNVLDNGFVGAIPNISTNPDGSVQEGVPFDRERIGKIAVNNIEINVDMIRVSDADAGTIWLFSADTLAQIPDIHTALQTRHTDTKLPPALVKNEFLGAPLWQWLALLLAIPASAALSWLLINLAALPIRYWRHSRKQLETKHWVQVSGPLWLVVGVLVDALFFESIGLPILYRHYYYILLRIGYVTGVAWAALRLLTWGMEGLRLREIAHGRPERGSVILLGQRLLKVFVFLFAGLTIMRALGFDMSAALAGLGIGGLALSFGAQKTIENLFGGVSVLGDDVIRVGDLCRIGDRVGTVEDISLRSTRIRTAERTELSIPNGALATVNVENFSRRDKILFNPSLGLRYETTPDQLRYLLAELRRLLCQHPKVDTDTARARFSGFGDNALLVEIYSLVRTADFAEFTAIREDLLLGIMDIINKSGTGFAFPSRTIYLGKDTGLDQEMSEAAIQKTRQWQEEQRLPFPNFSPEEIAKMRDTLPYPHFKGSTNGKK